MEGFHLGLSIGCCSSGHHLPPFMMLKSKSSSLLEISSTGVFGES
jgi:hypothetical protein